MLIILKDRMPIRGGLEEWGVESLRTIDLKEAGVPQNDRLVINLLALRDPVWWDARCGAPPPFAGLATADCRGLGGRSSPRTPRHRFRR